MKGEVFFTGDRQTDRQTDGHRDSMTESAQWADSVKIRILLLGKIKYEFCSLYSLTVPYGLE